MNSKLLLSVLFTGGVFAAGLLDAPYRGCISNGLGVQFIHGLRGSFAATEARVDGVISAACSERYTVVKTNSALVLLDRAGTVVSSQETGGGPALVAFDERGEPAFAYFPGTGALLGWSGGGWDEKPYRADGEVLAIAASGDGLLLAQRREGKLWITRWRDGGILGDEPVAGIVETAALLSDGTALLAAGSTLRMRTPQGAESEHSMPGPVRALAPMIGGWIAVETEAGRMAVEAGAGGLRQYRLAGGAQ